MADLEEGSPCGGEVLLTRAPPDITSIDCVLEGSNSGFISHIPYDEAWTKTPLMEELGDLCSTPASHHDDRTVESMSQWRVQGGQLIKLADQCKTAKVSISALSPTTASLLSMEHELSAAIQLPMMADDNHLPLAWAFDEKSSLEETASVSSQAVYCQADINQALRTTCHLELNSPQGEPIKLSEPLLVTLSPNQMTQSKIKKLHPCSICGMCFESIGLLTDHVVSHALCTSCGLVFRNSESLEIHKSVQHMDGGAKPVAKSSKSDEKKFGDPDKKTISSASALLQIATDVKKTMPKEKKTEVKPKNITLSKPKLSCTNGSSIIPSTMKTKVFCTICQKSFRSTSRLHMHIRTVHNKCTVCDAQYRSLDELYKHERAKHFKCNICGWTATGVQGLELHTVLHIQCLQCLERFKNQQALLAHYAMSNCRSPIKSLIRDNAVTSSTHSCKRNIASLSSDQPDSANPKNEREEDSKRHHSMKSKKSTANSSDEVVCVHCDKTFPDDTALEEHQDEEHYQCWDCQVVFKTLDSLTSHGELQHFCCAVCKKFCGDHEGLVAHKRRKHVKCRLCKAWLMDNEALGQHEATSRFPCTECQLVFCTSSGLRLHEKETHLLCSVCHVVCESRQEMQAHTHYPCQLCSLEFPTATDLHSHQYLAHALCIMCGGVFRDGRALDRHMLVHHSTPSCPLCPAQLHTMDLLARHMKDTHIQCDFCRVYCVNESNLRIHILDKHEQQEKLAVEVEDRKEEEEREAYPDSTTCELPLEDDIDDLSNNDLCCPHCGISAGSQQDLALHIRSLHAKDPKIRKLHKRRSSDGDVMQRLAENSPSRQTLSESEAASEVKVGKSQVWQCDTCNKVFNMKRNLKAHVRRVHTDKSLRVKTTFTCPCCSTQFTSRNQFSSHKLICAKIQDAKNSRAMCNICGKTFSTSGNLAQHKRIHTSERPYKCDTCGKTFVQNGTLYRHKTVHTKETPFACNVCGKQFGLKGNLVMHLRNIHKVKFEDVSAS